MRKDTYKNMTGSLFTGEPLEFAGTKPNNTWAALSELAANVRFGEDTVGHRLRLDALWESFGRELPRPKEFDAMVTQEISQASISADKAVERDRDLQERKRNHAHFMSLTLKNIEKKLRNQWA